MKIPAIAALLACAFAPCSFAAGDLREMLERYAADRGSLSRVYKQPSPARSTRFGEFYRDWLGRLAKVDFDGLDEAGRIDYLLFSNHLNHEVRQLEIQARTSSQTVPLLPFAEAIYRLEDARRRMDTLDPAKAAATLAELSKRVEAARAAAPGSGRTVAYRAAAEVDRLRAALKTWFGFYDGYDPLFTWWVAAPYRDADKSLADYAAFLREKIVGLTPGDTTTIVGDPIGREALLAELAYEMIPYSPEELVDIANQEFAWCESEMKKASRELGYGDDWHRALEFVKTRYVEPGKQATLVRDLAREALEFIDRRNLITVPELARETWRMEMMSPERQLINPFFSGGEVMSISYPTAGMSHEQKLMSMRGNNIHFSRATVFHELIPGHHLQLFMARRYRSYRSVFSTPFLVEGWSLYWEMLLWDLHFQNTPEDRVGALFWRMHRAARIIFSLGFHLGKMTPEECVDFLVNRVGHERDNAAAEVRRSFEGTDGPLYQVAYMLGGLQFRAMRRELVDTGKMTDRAFHDAILQENSIPVEMIRASLTHQKLNRDFRTGWRFYEAGRSR